MRIATIITLTNNADNLIVRGVPVSSTLVEFDDNSLAIIDTGMADNSDLLEQLDVMGYKPSDFNLVLNTHLHPDHIGGNRNFINARIFISRKELAYHQSLEGLYCSSGQEVMNQKNVMIREMQRLRDKYRVSDLIGRTDQIEFLENHISLPHDIKLISVPGHSIDDRAFYLQGCSQNVLVTGDALYHKDLWRELGPAHIHLSKKLFFNNARQLSKFHGIIAPGHDFAFDNTTGMYMNTNEFIAI